MTRAEYQDYQERFTAGLAGVDYLTGTGSTFFSWSACEVCRRPGGGIREEAIAVTLGVETDVLSVCEDCIYFAEYGRLDDSTMLGIEENAE